MIAIKAIVIGDRRRFDRGSLRAILRVGDPQGRRKGLWTILVPSESFLQGDGNLKNPTTETVVSARKGPFAGTPDDYEEMALDLKGYP